LTSGLEIVQTESDDKNGTTLIKQQSTQCTTLDKWVNLVKLFALLDSLFTIVVPFLVITVMNSLIAWKLVIISKKASFLFNQSVQLDEANVSPTTTKPKIFLKYLEVVKLDDNLLKATLLSGVSRASTSSIAVQTAREQKLKKLSRAKQVLFFISLFFLIFNLPIAICKIRYAYQSIESFISPDASFVDSYNDWDETVERLTCYLYYLNFATNFLFYFLGFRKQKN
jgi:hypothetical protein